MALGITIAPNSLTVVFGESVSFTSTVTGENGAVTYQWLVDGENAGGTDDEATFVFTPSGVGASEISCTVTDEEPISEESDATTVTTKSVFEALSSTLSYLAKISAAV